jgi:hypothetical protein
MIMDASDWQVRRPAGHDIARIINVQQCFSALIAGCMQVIPAENLVALLQACSTCSTMGVARTADEAMTLLGALEVCVRQNQLCFSASRPFRVPMA